MTDSRFYFDPEGEGLAVFLGRTEAILMELAWTQGEVTVKSALSFWPRTPRPAYTTAMTVMVRLFEKGLLTRTRKGRNFVYTPTTSRDKFLKERIKTVRDCLKSQF